MFAKSALVVRSLFVAAVVSSLVACTLEPSSSDEQKGASSSAISANKKHPTNDASVDTANDGGISENDASCTKCDEDGGPSDNDGGVSDNDGGPANVDGGDDDDNDGGAWGDHDAGF